MPIVHIQIVLIQGPDINYNMRAITLMRTVVVHVVVLLDIERERAVAMTGGVGGKGETIEE